MWMLLLIAASTLLSEDLALVGAGVWVSEGRLMLIPAILAGVVGLVLGDLALMLAGRWGGRALARRLVSEPSLQRASAWIETRGAVVVLLSRFTPGLRLPTYLMAGVLSRRLAPFFGYFVLAALVWTPLLVGTSALLGASGARLGAGIASTFAAIVSIGWLIRRIPRWEFWPPWAVYLPLVPYMAFLALKHRSLTLFTLANPGIPTGGFVGESKSAILDHLRRGDAREFLPYHELLDGMPDHPVSYPVVLKPDQGERGAGVAVVRNDVELRAYLGAAHGATILQEYVPGLEFGIFYEDGRVTSITEKRFPAVTGDGRSSLRELILADPRARRLAQTYFRASRRSLDSVPAAGEVITLVEIGSHCRGAVFLDGTSLRTDALERTIHRIARSHPGFYYGRFDIRVPSVEALREGRDIRVLELNGVGAEPTHIYDPALSLRSSYLALARHWRTAFSIGARNRDRGFIPTSTKDLLAAIACRWQNASMGKWPCSSNAAVCRKSSAPAPSSAISRSR